MLLYEFQKSGIFQTSGVFVNLENKEGGAQVSNIGNPALVAALLFAPHAVEARRREAARNSRASGQVQGKCSQ